MKFYGIFESHNFKRNVGQGKPWKGKSLSEETKAKISSSKIGVSTGRRVEYEHALCPICGKEFERKKNSKLRQYCSEKCSRSYRKGKTYEELYGEDRSKEIIAKWIDSMCQKDMFYVSKPHRILKDAMVDSGLYIGFSTSERLYYFEIDELNRNKKIAIEVDGDYWHTLPKKIIADKRKNTYLTNRGYTVLRFWEHEIYNDLNMCLKRIEEALNVTNQ
jgi:very-short-patch-repair endonuclease